MVFILKAMFIADKHVTDPSTTIYDHVFLCCITEISKCSFLMATLKGLYKHLCNIQGTHTTGFEFGLGIPKN